MKQTKTHDFPFNPYFNIICILVVAIVGAVFFSFLTRWQNSTAIMSLGEIKLALVFIFLNLLILLFQFIRKKKNRLSVLVFFIVLALFTISFLLRELFTTNNVMFIFAHTFSLIAAFFVFMLLEFVLLQVITDHVENDQENIVFTKTDLRRLQSGLLVLSIFITLLPLITLEFEQPTLILGWILLLAIFIFALSYGNYRFLIKKVIIGKTDLVLAYRSAVLYLSASEKQIADYQVEKMEIEHNVGVLEVEKKEKVSERQYFEAIENEKPQLAEKIDDLNNQLTQLNIDQVKADIETKTQKNDNLQDQYWVQNYALEYDELSENLVLITEQLETANQELEQTIENAEKMKQALKELTVKIDTEIEKQDSLKTKYIDIDSKKTAFIEELKKDTLEENQMKKLESKIEKAIAKENELNEKINQLERVIASQREKQDECKRQLNSFEEVDIPDYQYAITSLNEKLELAYERQDEINVQFQELLQNDHEYQETQKLLIEAEGITEHYQNLLEEKLDMQKTLDIDCIAEISVIDEAITKIEQSIEQAVKTDSDLDNRQQKSLQTYEEVSQNKLNLLNQLLNSKERD